MGQERAEEEPSFEGFASLERLLGALDSEHIPNLVLIVDDEPHILRSLERLMSLAKITTCTASSGDEALTILAEREVAVLISDQTMPGMSGTDLLHRAEQDYPEVVRVMLTGAGDLMTAVEAINRGEVFRFATKPWDNRALLGLVEAALEHCRLLHRDRIHQQLVESQNEHLRAINDELERRVRERTRELEQSRAEIQHLYRELEDSFDETLRSIISVMELGDIAIADHCRRTAARAVMFAEYLGLSDDERRALERAALLHWIGLISAPTTVLRKPLDSFDAEEQAAWEFHTILGYQTIARIPALERPSLIVLNYLRLHEEEEFATGQLAGVSDVAFDEALLRSCKLLNICSAFERHRTLHGGTVTFTQARGRDPRRLYLESLELLNRASGSRYDPVLLADFRDFLSTQGNTPPREMCLEVFDDLEVGMTLARVVETRQGIPVASRDATVDEALLERLERFERTIGLNPIYVWS